MTPSRSAHGQISSWLTPIRSITASATIAPAGICAARPSETPGSLARSARSIAASRSAHRPTSLCLRNRFA